MSEAKQSPGTYGSERLIAFSDAVMAVAITLLVLDLKLPEGLTEGALYVAVPDLSHALWCYVLSFIVIGLLWMAHHNQFAHIRAVDGVLMWLNLFFLMAVARLRAGLGGGPMDVAASGCRRARRQSFVPHLRHPTA
ncbi:MAG: DUF1211 domain-containing protein, partial [Hyphomicrobium sp.]|nr:DUF1211 domain-containing protein [Hyphomicrobium sp.]